MARQGHCQVLPHGSELAAQVGYRLGGITPDRSLSRADQERQIDYRIGSGGVDSRQVWFLGSGGTADLLGYRPGQRLTAVDGRVVREAMFGIDRRTGERIRVRQARNQAARIAAAPVLAVMEETWRRAGADPTTAWSSVNKSAQLRALMRAGRRPSGTVVFTTVAALLRSHELAWDRHMLQVAHGNRDSVPPPFRVVRREVMRRLGAHHRALHEAGQVQSFGGEDIDTTLPDADLGEWIWGQVEAESQRMVVRGNAGYEMTLTCPKSFSVAALLDDPARREEWLDTVREATTAALDELMRRVGHGRTGHSGDGQEAAPIKGDGYAATVSIESHSRELDPHLHGHVMIPNRVLCVDGVERAIATGGTDLINHAWWLQAQFERLLRQISVDRGLVTGWQMDLANQQWEVAGADRAVLEFFSQGQALVQSAVAEALEGDGGRTTKAQLRRLDSRAKRQVTGRKGDQQLTWEQIRARMQARASAGGIDLATAFAAPAPDPAWQPQAWSDEVWSRTIEQVVCEHKSAEITARIDAAVRAFAPHEWTDEQVRDTVRHVITSAFSTGQTTARGRVGVRKHASNRVLDAEQRAWSAFTSGFDANAHRIQPEVAKADLKQWRKASGWAAAGREFTPGQQALFDQMTSGTDRVSVVVGAAGSGKTTAIDAARHVLAANGQHVYGISVAAIAAQGLKHAAKVRAGTVAWLVNRVDFHTNPLHPTRRHIDQLEASPDAGDKARAKALRARFALPAMDHLVIDEASMIPATDLATVLEWTGANDITVTLVGDHKQLQAVGPSSLFPRMRGARPCAELDENLRQQDRIGRECAAFLRDGDAEAALSLLADAGQLVVVASQAEAERTLVDAWARKAHAITDPFERLRACGIESQRNDQVDVLNALARTTARAEGWLTGDDVRYTHRGRFIEYAAGDQVIITRNSPRKDGTVLANGTRGIIERTDPGSVTIASRDEAGQEHHDQLTTSQIVRATRHGYAMTTHKLQGQTLRSLIVDVGPDRDLSSAYVAFTRHRTDVLAVVNIADVATGPEVERLIAAGPDARRDAVIAMTATAIRDRGFATAPTAHEAIGRALSTGVAEPVVDVTPSTYRDGHGLT